MTNEELSEIDRLRFRTEVLGHVLDSYESEYAHRLAQRRELEGKANRLVTVPGILLAALIAVYPAIPPIALLFAAAGVAGLLLVSSISLAVLSMRVRTVADRPTGAAVAALAEGTVSVRSGGEMAARLGNFIEDYVRLWERAVESIAHENVRKADHLRRAHLLLVSALLSLLMGPVAFSLRSLGTLLESSGIR